MPTRRSRRRRLRAAGSGGYPLTFPAVAGRLIRSLRDRASATVAAVLAVLAAVSLVLTACGDQPKRAARDADADAVKALTIDVERLAHQGEFAGAVLVDKNGQVRLSRAYGLADRSRRIPNTVQTRFRIASMTKMFTAVAVLQLVEAGKVKLTAPLSAYVPDYPNRDVGKVTIRQLLTHTGGLDDIPWRDWYAHRNELRTLGDYVQRYSERGLKFEPGRRWSYSNYGFLLLGVVIENVTGESYYDYVQQHVYAPAGMTRSGSLPENQPVPERAIGYNKPPRATAWVPSTDTLPYRGTSFGWGYSTVGDLNRFAHALLSHKLLSPDATKLLITGKARMSREFERASGRGARYAYGFFDARDAGGTGWVGHSGAWWGMYGELRIYPKSGYVAAMLANINRLPAADTAIGAGARDGSQGRP